MSTNMTGFQFFFQNLCILVLWAKVASALEGLSSGCIVKSSYNVSTFCNVHSHASFLDIDKSTRAETCKKVERRKLETKLIQI